MTAKQITPRAKVSQLFQKLKQVEAVSYDADVETRKARQEWARACEALHIEQHPELDSMIEEIGAAQVRLDSAKMALSDRSKQLNIESVFSKYYR